MSLWLRAGGPVGICARCHRKMYLRELSPDPNIPGLLVCDDDLDLYDPYRLPQRRPESIVVIGAAPDEPLDFGTIWDDGATIWDGGATRWDLED